MANINRKRTDIVRVSPNFKKLLDNLSREKSFQEKEDIANSRITEAMYNQYNKYPDLLREIKMSKLGKWKGQ